MRKPNRKKHILLNAPNTIAYVRFSLLLIAIGIAFKFGIFSFKSGILVFWFLFIGGSLDAVDGFLARKFNQSTKTGAAFDMILDRMYTIFSLILLILLYSDYWIFFLSLLLLDVGSHLAHLYYVGISRANNHKVSFHTHNFLFKKYYSNRVFLFLCCSTYELWLGLLYILYWYRPPILLIGLLVCTPGFLIKIYIHVVQFISAINGSLELDIDRQHEN